MRQGSKQAREARSPDCAQTLTLPLPSVRPRQAASCQCPYLPNGVMTTCLGNSEDGVLRAALSTPQHCPELPCAATWKFSCGGRSARGGRQMRSREAGPRATTLGPPRGSEEPKLAVFHLSTYRWSPRVKKSELKINHSSGSLQIWKGRENLE